MSRSLVTFFSLILVCITGAAFAADSYLVPSGNTVTIDEHGECRKVTNPGSGTRMVPTKSASEWTSVRNNPNSLTLAACPPACSGTSYAGYCWFAAPPRTSCTETCSARGGDAPGGTINYAGSGGSDANCAAVIRAMYPSTNLTVSPDQGSISPNLGCYVYGLEGYDPSQAGRLIRNLDGGLVTTSVSARTNSGPYDFDALQRVCSCQPGGSTCGGKSMGGYCWYRGTDGQSCSTVCASRGGVNMAGTRDYAGSGGSNANCENVGRAFGYGPTLFGSGVNMGATGCIYWSLDYGVPAIARSINATTTAEAPFSSTSPSGRFCACNN